MGILGGHLFVRFAPLLLLLATVLSGQEANEAREPLPFEFDRCPCKAELGNQATIDLPKGFIFIDQANAGKFLEECAGT